MEHIDTIKWAVVFTDIKDFTLKTSLLTQLQITKFLNKQDEIRNDRSIDNQTANRIDR